MALIVQWIDLVWLPIAFFTVHRRQRLWALGLVVSGMLMMRMQIELMAGIGFEQGFTGLVSTPVQSRALAVYSLCYVGFIILAHYSPQSRGIMVFAAAIGMFFMAFFVSSFLMIL